MNPLQFRFPFNEKCDNIRTIRINNPIARKIIHNIDVLINMTCTDKTQKSLWKRAINNIIQVINILQKS